MKDGRNDSIPSVRKAVWLFRLQHSSGAKWLNEGLLHWDYWLKPGSPEFLPQVQRLRLFLTIHRSSGITYRAKLPIPNSNLVYADS